MRELIGAPVEVAPLRVEVSDPVLDGPLPGGTGHLVANATRAILRVAGVGSFAVAGGEHVGFEPAAGAEERAVSMWLHGTVAALLLAQRGQFALHASVVDVGGRGLAVAGLRRAGKSTTALRLMQLGHPLVTDDVSPLQTSEGVTVHPYTRPAYVRAETAATLGLDVSDATPVLPDHPKLALHLAERAPLELGTVAVLERSETVEAVNVVRTRGAAAHTLVERNVYRADILRPIWQAEMFAWAAEVARSVPIHVVTRPAETWSVNAVAHALQQLAISSSRSAS